jgi:alpha-1,3/alpha-1,6-mannosyltransferase
MWWLNHRAPANEKFDIIIVDQLSVSIPLLRWTGAKIFFYCHFPDKLLTKRESLLKKIYRLPVDFVEEITTGKFFNSTRKTYGGIPPVVFASTIEWD